MKLTFTITVKWPSSIY